MIRRLGPNGGDPEFILEEQDIINIKKDAIQGYALPIIAQSLGVSRRTLNELLRRTPEAAKAYAEGRKEFIQPQLDWFKSIQDKNKLDSLIDPSRMRAFEFIMRSRAQWLAEDVDSFESKEEALARTEFAPVDIVAAKVKANFLEEHEEEIKRRIKEAQKVNG